MAVERSTRRKEKSAGDVGATPTQVSNWEGDEQMLEKWSVVANE